MKTSQLAALAAAFTAVGPLVPTSINAQTSAPQAPAPAGLTGSLAANPTIVMAGEKTQLSWSINYPSVVKNYVTITPPGTGGTNPGSIVPLTDLYCDIRIIGQGVTQQSGSSFIFIPTEATINVNNTSTYSRIFYGTNPQINPGNVFDLKSIFGTAYTNNMVRSGRIIRFGGRYFYNNTWSTHYKSNSGDNVRFLVHGDVPPSNVPDYNAPSLESFLRPYLDTTGKVKIGPMDVIVFMELTHSSSQKSNVGYDLQDMVLLVTFRKP